MLARHHSKPSGPLRAAQAAQLQLVNDIRARLSASDARRIGLHHAAVLLTLQTMPDGKGDVPAIYRALIEHGHAMVMSRLYRALKVLEGAGMLYREWVLHEGRPRSTYRLIDGGTGADGEHVCPHCGAALSRR